MNKEKQWTKWEKTRRLGKWKYIFLYGLLWGGGVFFLIRFLFDTLQGNRIVIYEYLLFSILFGLTFGIGSWFLTEKKYNSFSENK